MLPRARMWWRSRSTAGAGSPPGAEDIEAPKGRPGVAPQGGSLRQPRPSSPDARSPVPPLTLGPDAMTAPPPPQSHGPPPAPYAVAPATAEGRLDGAAVPPADGGVAHRGGAAEPTGLLGEDTGPALYLSHFGLTARPFTLVPDPDFLFWSRAHRRAYAILEYGVLTRAPITLVTGEVGAGKTTLIHHLLRRLGDSVRVGLVSNAHGARGELLRWILMALGQAGPEDADYVQLFSAFQRYVIAEYAAGRRVVLIFDEAQNLGRDVLEELRLLTNINANGDELLQLILVGQPELRDIIQRRDMIQFTQRVDARFHLAAMEADTVRDYIEHRLAIAGAPYMLFDEGAVARIHRETRGVPRLVNQLCDLALVYAFTEDAQVVTDATVAHVIDDGVFVAGPTGHTTAAHPEEARRHD